MPKFNRDEWEQRMRNEMADEIAGEAAAAARAAQDDAQLKKELTDMFGSSDYSAIVKALGEAEGYSASEIKAMNKAAELAKKKLRSNNPREAEKIIMSNRGLREARKRSGKGCVVVLLMILGSASLSIWGLVEATRALLG